MMKDQFSLFRCEVFVAAMFFRIFFAEVFFNFNIVMRNTRFFLVANVFNKHLGQHAVSSAPMQLSVMKGQIAVQKIDDI